MDAEPTTRDFAAYKNDNARFGFFDEILTSHGANAEDESLNALLGYIDFTAEQLRELAGFDEREAIRTAADTVFSGLSAHMREHRRHGMLRRLTDMDAVIRQYHDIDPRLLPWNHDDPIVASFYSTLEPHLFVKVPGDRHDPWHQ